MFPIAASAPFSLPPTWAVWERQLFDLPDRSANPCLVAVHGPREGDGHIFPGNT